MRLGRSMHGQEEKGGEAISYLLSNQKACTDICIMVGLSKKNAEKKGGPLHMGVAADRILAERLRGR